MLLFALSGPNFNSIPHPEIWKTLYNLLFQGHQALWCETAEIALSSNFSRISLTSAFEVIIKEDHDTKKHLKKQMTLTSPKMETLRFSEICASKEWHYIVVEDSTPQKSGDAQLRSGVLAGEFKSHLCEARNRTVPQIGICRGSCGGCSCIFTYLLLCYIFVNFSQCRIPHNVHGARAPRHATDPHTGRATITASSHLWLMVSAAVFLLSNVEWCSTGASSQSA